ncbi:MAG: hypothetical protein L3V56_08990 [Candidatus Magnetoovum sp. WYHC-5]|nr:hypothetical protein [Candidatus Magnetoovum sp. WYHC-5]
MQAIKQILNVPESGELIIKLPNKIPKNETVEVIIIYKENKRKIFKEKLECFKDLDKDELFQEDLNEVAKSFSETDKEGWE